MSWSAPKLSTADVSVIVIARNAERHLASALRSIEASNHRPGEVVLVDGSSTDATRDIASSFGFVRIVHQESRGIANAYNEGISTTRGALVAFLSADDCWMPDKLERQVAALSENPSIDIVACHVQHSLEPGCAIPVGFRVSLLDAAVPAFIMESILVRRETLVKVGAFDSAFAVSEDTDWFARARDAGVSTVVLPETLVWKRVHDRNSSLTEAGINGLLLRALRGTIERKRADATGG